MLRQEAFAIPVQSIVGTNTVTLSTGLDLIGWPLAALVSPPPPTPVSSESWGVVKGRYR